MDRMKENSSAPLLKRTFFCVIAANAENREEESAIKNHVIGYDSPV
ncbi:MAG: hypothetical protein WC900_09275 [Oscillospiraceae bacterium]|jgi:hypothetical protein